MRALSAVTLTLPRLMVKSGCSAFWGRVSVCEGDVSAVVWYHVGDWFY